MKLTLRANRSGVRMGRPPMFVLPPPDPNESREPPALELRAPIAVYLGGLPVSDGERTASAVLGWRPGVLVVAAHAVSGP